MIVLPSHDKNNTDVWDQIPACLEMGSNTCLFGESPSFFPTMQNKQGTITDDWFILDFFSF